MTHLRQRVQEYTNPHASGREETAHVCKSDYVLLLRTVFTRRSFLEHLDHELFLNLIQFFQCRLQGKTIFEGAFAENVSKLKGTPPYKQFGIFHLPAVTGHSSANILYIALYDLKCL